MQNAQTESIQPNQTGEHPRIIVSLTSYPQRINIVWQVIQSLLNQTKKADLITLWLAEEQFVKKEKELPGILLEYVEHGVIELHWCSNLKPHTKYFYAFQTYKDDIIVTVDDDVIYREDLIEKLFESYLRYPKAVSAARVHYIPVVNRHIPPYMLWPKETNELIGIPNNLLFATGVGGVLYPPHLFDEMFFNKELIERLCLNADDLWLKTMELHSNVPVVLAMHYDKLLNIEGSQENCLYADNGTGGQNDVQLRNIIEWYDGLYGKGTFVRLLYLNTNRTVLNEISDYLYVMKKFLYRKYVTK